MELKEEVDTANRQDEWMIEQGMAGHKLPILDQSGRDTIHLYPPKADEIFKDEETIASVENGKKLFKRERPGWKGYVEWEDYPEKKAKARKLLTSQRFPSSPDFMFGPIPETNPVIAGDDFVAWHEALGGELATVAEDSWRIVQQEKHPEMLHLLKFPYNGEPPKRLVTSKSITPSPLHFVRNHGGIPIIDKDKWDFSFDGLVQTPKRYSLEDLMDEARFPRIEKNVTMQCSGTRRIEQIGLYAGQGDEVPQAPWAEGAIGTARYVGISLKKVIKDCGGLVKPAKHLELYGAETYVKDLEVGNYVVSVPWSKVKANEVLLAWEMNGEPLPKIHGYPLRVVVLGYIGARSVKWLYRIKAIENPSRAPVQSREYLYFNQQVGKYNLRPTDGIQIQEMPVSSAIMSPWNNQAVIHVGKIRCKGWAYSGGGRWPERVELSADGGFTWYEVPAERMSTKGRWVWRTWEIDLPCEVEGWIEIVCRCWDNSLNTQPLNIRAAWNWGLHVTSSAHRIKVYSINKGREVTRKRLEKYEQKGVPLAPLTRYETIPVQTLAEYEHFWKTHDPRDVDD
ncbi:Eukaryotic molybdopterin oxidoreductase [Penicillium citrinum]|uniref:Eukaryotic molybdopterin oxidoreductase n=1 Tax=Penicillium citrinum TaxID=5077 RepID=A0A9W9TMD8_PENCI|nr:Eukaryotic molybdopterin oxidoreductase [Penicillium citrinum]KAJ5231637.1 Eukaryotic molybdopterin oxidoreductase [Penicillium citrinum]